MLEDIAATVYTRPLAIPEGEHAIVLAMREQVDLLTAPDGGGGQLFVDPGLKMDGVLLQVVLGVPKALVQIAQRRTAVTGNETGGVQALRLVTLLLQHRQAGQGLCAGQVQIAGGKAVFIIQTNISQGHADTSLVLIGSGLLRRDVPARQPCN